MLRHILTPDFDINSYARNFIRPRKRSHSQNAPLETVPNGQTPGTGNAGSNGAGRPRLDRQAYQARCQARRGIAETCCLIIPAHPITQSHSHTSPNPYPFLTKPMGAKTKTILPSRRRTVPVQFESDFMDVPEAADYLRVKPCTIYAQVDAGVMPYFKVGRLLRFSRQKLKEWAERRMR